MQKVTKGSTEYLVVDVTDRLGQITTLVGTLPKYDVMNSAGTLVMNQATAIAEGMKLKCLVNTSAWAEDKYRLFINFANSPEAPKLGPFYFKVTDD